MICIFISSDRYIPSIRDDVPDHGVVYDEKAETITVCVRADLPSLALVDLRNSLECLQGYAWHDNYPLLISKLVESHLRSRVLSGSLRFDRYTNQWRWLGLSLENTRIG